MNAEEKASQDDRTPAERTMDAVLAADTAWQFGHHHTAIGHLLAAVRDLAREAEREATAPGEDAFEALRAACERLLTHADWLRDGPEGPAPYSMVSVDYQDDLRAVLAAVPGYGRTGTGDGAGER